MHSQILLSTLLVAASWSLTLALLAGIGSHFLHAFGRRLTTAESVAQAALAGYGLVIGFLQIWQLVLPIGVITLALLIAVGAVGLWTERTSLGPRVQSVLRRPLLVAGAALPVLWMANSATGPLDLGDSMGYHLPFTRWMRLYSIVPGLANLDGRLGYNSSSLLFASLFDVGPLEGMAHHLATGPLVTLLWAMILIAAVGWIRQAPGTLPASAGHVTLVAFLAPLGLIAVSRHLPSLSTDLPIVVLTAAISWQFCRFVFAHAGASDPEARFGVALLGLLTGTAVACKLPIAPFAGAVLATLLILTARDLGARAVRRSLVALALAALLVVPWAVRGIVISGYPAFPMTVLGAPVDWATPREQAMAEAEYSKFAARNDKEVSRQPWFPRWLRYDANNSMVLVPVAVFSLSVVGMGLLALKRRRRSSLAPLVVALPGVLGCAIWFALNPMVRFGFGVLWATAALSLAAAVSATAGFWEQRARRAGLASVLAVIALGTLLSTDGIETIEPRRGPLLHTKPHSAGGFEPVRDGIPVRYLTSTGLEVVAIRAPGRGLPLLSTTRPVVSLDLRGDDPSDGFIQRDGWQPVWFPNRRSDFLFLWRSLRETGQRPRRPTKQEKQERQERGLDQVEWLDPRWQLKKPLALWAYPGAEDVEEP